MAGTQILVGRQPTMLQSMVVPPAWASRTRWPTEFSSPVALAAARQARALPRPDPLEPAGGLAALAQPQRTVDRRCGRLAGWHLLAVFVLGTILMRSAGCCVNDVADRDFDRHVKRTAQRPVTAGKGSVKPERWRSAPCWHRRPSGLVLTTNTVTIVWSFAALAIAIAYLCQTIRVDAAGGAGRGLQLLAFRWPFGGGAGAGAPVTGLGAACHNLFWVLAYDTRIRDGGTAT